MSSFKESLLRSVVTSPEASQLENDIRKRWPNLGDALYGASPAGNGSPCLPSCSIIVFVEGDKLKFCLTPQGIDRVGFGTFSKPLDGWDGLEAALAAGDFSWRAKKGRR